MLRLVYSVMFAHTFDDKRVLFLSSFSYKVLVVPMLAPKSYTREDVIELQCHGNDVCLRRVLRACLDAGARLAEPGQNFLCLYRVLLE